MCSSLFQIWKEYIIKTINPWSQWLAQEKKIFCVNTYLETKSFKTVQANFRWKFNFKNYPKKSQIYRWVHTFQAIIFNPDLTGYWLQVVLTMCMQWEILAEGVRKSPSEDIPKNLDSHANHCKEPLKKHLKLYPYRIQIKHKLTPAHMEKRSVMCSWLEKKIEEYPDSLDDAWFSD